MDRALLEIKAEKRQSDTSQPASTLTSEKSDTSQSVSTNQNDYIYVISDGTESSDKDNSKHNESLESITTQSNYAESKTQGSSARESSGLISAKDTEKTEGQGKAVFSTSALASSQDEDAYSFSNDVSNNSTLFSAGAPATQDAGAKSAQALTHEIASEQIKLDSDTQAPQSVDRAISEIKAEKQLDEGRSSEQKNLMQKAVESLAVISTQVAAYFSSKGDKEPQATDYFSEELKETTVQESESRKSEEIGRAHV